MAHQACTHQVSIELQAMALRLILQCCWPQARGGGHVGHWFGWMCSSTGGRQGGSESVTRGFWDAGYCVDLGLGKCMFCVTSLGRLLRCVAQVCLSYPC